MEPARNYKHPDAIANISKPIRVDDEGAQVVLSLDDKTVVMPWQAARAVAAALQKHSRRAEDFDKAKRLIDDAQYLFKAGLFIPLSVRRDVNREAAKEFRRG